MTKRWIYLGVLVASGIAFAVDRLFLNSPSEAEAQAVPKASAPKSAAPAKQGRESPLTLDPSLAWLAKLADPRPDRDVFSPSQEWLLSRRQAAQAANQSATNRGPAPGSPEAFKDGHRLQATTVMGGDGLAVVDGQCLRVGDTLDGFRLARVAAIEVEFRRGKERVVLNFPTSSGAKQVAAVPATADPYPPPATDPAKAASGDPSRKTPAGEAAWAASILRSLLGETARDE